MHHLFIAYQQAQMERLRLEVSMREAELRHLRSQMDPHFLFNSLNTVRALISPENQEARGALTHLSELLRNSLQQEAKPLIPLKDELSILESHLAIEQLRFGSRLRVKIHLSEGLETYLVPPLLIQTLVENAIKHGISKREQGGTLTLSICKNEGQLHCVICNPGTLEISQPEGLGLANIRERLQHLYQDAASFILQQRGPNQVRAAFRLPLLTSPR
jgi:two-component system, LytTR family, sensor kinase